MIREGEILGEVRDYEGGLLELSVAEYDGVILYQTGTLQVLGDGPMIAYGKIVNPYDERKERIVSYWEKEAEISWNIKEQSFTALWRNGGFVK